MLGDITAADELYIVTGYTDMRKSIDGLCAIVEQQLHMDPRRSALYLFCGKRCDRVVQFSFMKQPQTMCVQGYLKQLRNGDIKDDTLKREAENAILN